MRAPLDVMMRWWNQAVGRGNGHANGHANVNGNGHSNGNGHNNGNGHRVARFVAEPHPPHEEPAAPAPEPPWLAQLDREGIPRSLHYPTTTLGRIVDEAAARFADRTALVYNQRHWTYAELLARVNRLAGGLSRLGVRKGDRVVLTLPNCPEYVTAFFAVQKLGAVVVNAGPLMGLDDLRSLLALTSPHVVIGLDLQLPQLMKASADCSPAHFVWITLQSYQTLLKRLGYQYKLWHGREPIAPASAAEHVTLANLLENAPARPPTVEPSPDAIAVLQPTSGTTGGLKLAQLSHRNLLANATQVAIWMGAREGQERVLTVLPMFHVYGLTTGLINPIYSAATIILQTRFDAAETLDVLERERPTVFPFVPAICDALCREIERRRPDGPAQPLGVRACISGAAPLPRELAERFEKLAGVRAVEGYGLSESSPVTHANPITRPRYGSIGLPMPDTLCRVVDLDHGTRDVPTGQPGELLVSGPQIMSGYYHNAEATHRALWTDDQGRSWLRTGDVVRMDEDGFFQIIDRRKDMIIRSGLKVYPAKVERVLRTDERVNDVAVIGRPHPLHTEEVIAFVSLKPTFDEVDHDAIESELRVLCRKHLAAYEVPAKFEFIDQIPRSALGKTLKNELRERPPTDTPTKPQKPHKSHREREAA